MATRYPGPVMGPNRYNVRDFAGTGLQKKLGRRSWEDQQIDQFNGSGMADKLAGKFIAPTVTNPADNTASGINWGKVAGDAQKGLDRATPYLSNVANALRKPPRPIMGKAIDRVSLGRVSNAAELNDIDSGTRAANLATDNAVDSQTASAIKGANLAQGFMAKNRSYAQNAQVNTGIANQEAQMNLNVDAQNAAKVDQYNQDKIGSQMAYQREQSQNLANFSDKRMAEINANDARRLDEKKFNILSQIYTNKVARRAVARAADVDEKDVNGDVISDVLGTSIKAFGGKLRKVSSLYESGIVNEQTAMFDDGGKIGDPKPKGFRVPMDNLGAPVPMQPKYNLSALRSKQTRDDSTMYKIDFDNYRNNESTALYYKDKYDRYGVPLGVGKTDMDIFNRNSDQYSAYKDVDEQLGNLTARPGYKPATGYYPGKFNDLKKKHAEGGPLSGGPGKGTYQTQADVDKANLFAKDFSARRNYINPGDSYVAKKPGDPVVGFTNLATGKPYQGEYSKMPASRLVPMPDDVKDLYWDKSYNQPYYKDGEDMKYVDTKWWNHPRFTQSREAMDKNNAVLASRAGAPVAMHQLGGPLVSFPKMRGRLRKIV